MGLRYRNNRGHALRYQPNTPFADAVSIKGVEMSVAMELATAFSTSADFFEEVLSVGHADEDKFSAYSPHLCDGQLAVLWKQVLKDFGREDQVECAIAEWQLNCGTGDRANLEPAQGFKMKVHADSSSGSSGEHV